MANLGNTIVNGALRVINKANVADLDASGTITEGGTSLSNKYAAKSHTHAYVSGLSVSGKTITYTKGDGTSGTITTQDTVYTHPSYTKRDSGLYKITVDTSGHVSAATAVTKTDLTNLGLPSSNTDTLMTQTANTGETALPILTGSSASPSGAATGAYVAGVTITPSTKTITASKFVGSFSGNASTATKLATGRKITVNVGSTTINSFDGSADVTTGITGTLAVAHGGTGATTAAGALTNLGLTATAAELNVLDGITSTTAELNYVDGVTSNVQIQLNAKAPLASPTLTGTPKAPTAAAGTNTTQIATTAFVSTAINNVLTASDAMVFKGTIGGTDSGATVTALPASHHVGDTYKVITAGSYAGANCEVGDMLICVKTGTESTNADWTIVQTNIDGAVTGPASVVANRVAIFNGTTGKIIKDSGYTIASSVPSGAKFTDTTYAGDDTTITLSSGKFSQKSGVVTAATKGATANVTGTEGTTIKVPQITVDTYGRVTALSEYTLTNKNTTYSNMTAATSSAAGKAGLVPAPAAGKQTSFLRGDGTWVVPTNTTYAGDDTTITLSSGKFSQKSGIVTAGSAGPTANVTGSNNTTIKVPRITVDTYGRVTALSEYTLTNVNTDNNTHYTTKLVTGASSSASANAAVTSNGIYLNLFDDSTLRNSHNIVGSGKTTVTCDADGKITINSTESSLSKTDSGSGNVVTGLSVSGHAITVNKSQFNYAASASAGGSANTLKLSNGTADAARFVIFQDSQNNTSALTACYDADFKYNPSSNVLNVGNVSTSKVTLGEGCSLVYDSTNKCVNFVFA